VLVLNWNRRRLTERCIDSLEHEGSPWTAYVLNNGCKPDERYAYEADDRIVVVDTPTNLGFAAGVNLLAGRAIDGGAGALVLLNNDATLEQGALGELSAALGRGAAVACPMIIDASTGRVWGVGGSIRWPLGRTTSPYRGARPDEVPADPSPTDFGTGACLAIAAEAFIDVGDLDETYFAYWEETDWCVRAGRRGLAIVTCPSARVVHEGGVSSPPPARLQLLIRNVILFMRRNGRPAHWLTFVPFLVCWTIPTWSARSFVREPRATARAVVLALAWHLQRPRLPPPRTGR
jgi:GT2 family glycosyltransferase